MNNTPITADVLRGTIVRGVGGLYGVRVSDGADGEVLARARGVFRHEKITPTVGDTVTLSRTTAGEDFYTPEGERHNGKAEGAKVGHVIDTIEDRRNVLIRPPLANLDYLFAVVPCASPEPDLLTVDKLTAIAEHSDINVVIIINKADLAPLKADEIEKIYKTAGYKVFRVSGVSGEGTDALSGHISELAADGEKNGRRMIGAFAGASGAGKSTLMTRLFPSLSLRSAAVSRKTERGRHTTRHVELYPAETESGIFWLADTPGFSMLDFTRFDFFPVSELAMSFCEMNECLGKCRYTKCTHLCEDGCAVIGKVKAGEIAQSRHDSYKRIYEEIRSVPEWKRRQE